MKSLPLIVFLCLFLGDFASAQKTKAPVELSFAFLNGIGNHFFTGTEADEYNSIYVNSFRFQTTFGKYPKYRSTMGLIYGKHGYSNNWVCGENWDYCEMFGVPPIEVKTIERLHLISLFYNGKYPLPRDFYLQGGLSLDIPFVTSYHSRYTSSVDESSKDKQFDPYGGNIFFDITIGANLLVGKKYSINEKLDWFFEMEYRMYNLIAIRIEDYEDYHYQKNQKPWVFGVNVGVSITL